VMAENAPPSCVCFDWGGVLLRICRGFEEGAANAGLDLRPGAKSEAAKAARRGLVHEYQTGAIDHDGFCSGVSSSMDGLYSPEEISAIHDAWLLGEYEGVPALIERLHANNGVSTALLSNTNQRHWARRLEDFPTAASLHHPHASHLLGHAKPGVDIYRAFEEATGFNGARIVFFDDLPDNIDAARAHGWQGVLVDHEGDTAGQIAAALVSLGVLTAG